MVPTIFSAASISASPACGVVSMLDDLEWLEDLLERRGRIAGEQAPEGDGDAARGTPMWPTRPMGRWSGWTEISSRDPSWGPTLD